ncbi:MAG: hypothetical protein ACR2L9_07115 [Solirubrobacteraceae bacterium]
MDRPAGHNGCRPAVDNYGRQDRRLRIIASFEDGSASEFEEAITFPDD